MFLFCIYLLFLSLLLVLSVNKGCYCHSLLPKRHIHCKTLSISHNNDKCQNDTFIIVNGANSMAINSFIWLRCFLLVNNLFGVLLLCVLARHLAYYSERKCSWNRGVVYPICRSVCVSVWKVYCGKMDDWIRMPFRVVSKVVRWPASCAGA